MQLSRLIFKDHPFFKDLKLSFINSTTKKPYSVIVFVGENGCGKTTLLNEIFNYNKSQYIVNETTQSGMELNSLYLWQGSLFRNTINEAREVIDGETIYPRKSVEYTGGFNVYSLRSNNTINNINKCLEILEELDDSDIYNIVKENHLEELRCGQDVTSIINGAKTEYDINKYSSGQQEILLKLRDIRHMSVGTDCVLIDEPETSLHPRWQKEIIRLLSLMMTDTSGNIPQMFIATHSEKVLESLIEREDVLIVRLYKDNGMIRTENLNQMNLLLPKPTFAELDYYVFNIPSIEYQNELFNYFGTIVNKKEILKIDKKIEQKCKVLFSEDNVGKYYKPRTFCKREYKMLPTYIRNYSHHHNEMDKPTNEEVELSIEFLRFIIKNMVIEKR